MPVSANTLFHFTEKKWLKGILKNHFYPRYHLEDLSHATPRISIYKEAQIPMVCFCDLLFSQIKQHIDFYGEYGIGLRKSGWGIERGISPIIYLPEASVSSIHIQSIAIDVTAKLKSPIERKAIRKRLQDFYKYIKPYSGYAKNKKTKRKQLVIFYDEREWRYVPTGFSVKSVKRSNPAQIQRENERMKIKKLGFEAKDIKYIIVKSENEIPEFVDFIENELVETYNASERKLLVSKLISVQQIREDI